MKITKVESIHISVPYDHGGPLPKADAMPWRNMDSLFIKVETDDGITGWGEAFGFGCCGITKVAFDTGVAPLAAGRDPSDIAGLMTDLRRKLHNYGINGPMSFALSGLDIALWDIAGQVMGLPLYRLLGGDPIDVVPGYASLLRYRTPKLVTEFCEDAASRGHMRIKLHEIGVDEVAAAREAVGPHIALMVDTNCPWTADEAIAMARQFEPFELTWLEEPVWPPDDAEALARVRDEGRVPIAAGENAGTLGDFAHLIDAGAVDFVQPSVIKVGGISEMIKVLVLAAARGVHAAPHSPYFGPGLIATTHICASLPAPPAVERFYCDLEASPLGDMIEPEEGHMRVPQGPGLGLVVDEAILAKYRVG